MQPNPSLPHKALYQNPPKFKPAKCLPAEFVNHFPRVSNYKCFWNRCIA
jgi:hypothetical protein